MLDTVGGDVENLLKTQSLTPLKASGKCSSTLYAPTPHDGKDNHIQFDSRCAVALTALAKRKDVWNGGVCLEKDETTVLMQKVDAFAPGRDDGMLSIAEILDFAKKHEDQIKSLPMSIHGLGQEDVLKEALELLDHEKDNEFDRKEFRSFVLLLEGKHLQFLLEGALIEFRAFYGKGQRWWNLDHNTGSRNPSREELQMAAATTFKDQQGGVPIKRSTIQIGRDSDLSGGWLPPGWAADVWYYSSNNHPLHGIFCCDPNHPLTQLERLFMELVTFSFTFWIAGLKHRCVELKTTCPFAPLPLIGPWFENLYFYTFVVSTLGGVCLWWTLFLLFTMPKCGRVDRSSATKAEVAKANTFETAGNILGYLISLASLAGLAWRIYRTVEMHDVHKMHFRGTIKARISSYLFAWILMIFVYFNPVISWGQPDPTGRFSLGDLIGLGQWRVEKQKFQAVCLKALDMMERREPSLLLKPVGDEAYAETKETGVINFLTCGICFGNNPKAMRMLACSGQRPVDPYTTKAVTTKVVDSHST